MAIKFGRPIEMRDEAPRPASCGTATTLDLPRAHATQPQVGLVAADGAGAPPHRRRPDLADVHHRRQQQARADRRRCRASSACRSTRRARGRARDKARHLLHRDLSLHRYRRCATRPDRSILNDDNLINRASRAVKEAVPEIGVLRDAALDPFTSHGHDGILRDGIIVNDETVEQLAEAAVLQAEAGCRHHRAVGHDGRTDRRHPRSARRERLPGHGDHVVRDQVRVRLLRALSATRSASAKTLNGDKKHLLPGSGEWRRGDPRGRTRRRRRRRHGDGEAGPALSRRAPAGEGHVRHADLRLSGVGRVFDDHGGRSRTAGSTASAR